MANNNVIALASTKEYSTENLEYFRFRSSPCLVTAGEEDEEDEEDEEEENENRIFQSSLIF